jgi:hypothetical protein
MAEDTKGQETDELLEKARKRLKKSVDSDSHNRIAAIEDLRFLQGDQWDQGEKQRRKNRGRPCLQINVLPKYSKQVCGEMRMNKSQIKVHPVDSKADLQLSRIREGIIYNIEYLSNAEAIYDHAGKMLVDCGYGAWRVCTRYIDDEEDPFLQEIYMERILNPFSVYMDPDTKDQNFADAEWAFIISKMSKDEYEDEYGEKFDPGGDLQEQPTVGTNNEHWWDRDNVTVAEYFYKEYNEKKMCYLSDGQSLEKEAANEYIAKAKATYAKVREANPEQAPDDSKIPTILKERTVKIPKIKWKKITARRILDEKDWAGTFIPIILVTGEETNIEGKKFIHGLIRDAKDPQRMLNFWHTSACETVALAPKAPWIATARMIEGYEGDYLSANEDNLPVMKYNIDPSAAPGMKPERLPAANPPSAIFSEIARAEQNIKDTIGMYNTDVGDSSNEHLRDLSGAAVRARQMPGDVATYVYPDKMMQAIAHGGKIINDLIPHIYDTERDVRIRNADGTESFVPINTTVDKALGAVQDNPQRFQNMDVNKLQQENKKNPAAQFNDIRVGKYDIVISTGPTFATQRAEAVESMVKLATASKMSPVDKYFILHNSDFPGAEEYAAVIKRMIPTGLMPPQPGEPVMPPPPPPPQQQVLIAKTQTEGLKQKTEQLKLQVELMKLQKEIKGSDTEVEKKVIQMLQEISMPAGEHPADQIQEGGGQNVGMQGQAPQGLQGF